MSAQATDERLEGLGERIQEARMNRRFGLAELGRRIGADHSLIWRWESGQTQPRLVSILRLCDALDVTPEFLLGWEESA